MKKLISRRHQLVEIVEKCKFSFNNDFEEVSTVARRNGIPFLYVKEINE